ncbi:MAG: S-layer homology domain-containing protein [Acidimicrobiia bacterium]
MKPRPSSVPVAAGVTTTLGGTFSSFGKRRLWLGLVGLAVVLAVMSMAQRAEAADQTLNSGDYPNGFTVPAGDTWTLNPNADTTITSGGNIIVRGTLVMKPANGSVDHTIRFTGINESNFVGGGLDPVASDVGLWVVGDGRIIFEGESKQAWSYVYQSSWAGDEVRAAPNTPGNYKSFPLVTSTPPKNAFGYSAELLDLTRNVHVEGTPSGYAHVFIRSTRPSTIKNAVFRYVGPDPANLPGDTDATGRYGLHFHMAGDGSRGTIVDGVVIRDTKNHAFVPHASHGITFRNTIAYNVEGEAYWWDSPAQGVMNETNDVIFDHTVAALVTQTHVNNHSHRLSAYFLGAGKNMTVVDSVAVGVQRELGADRSAFIWPEDSQGTWVFRNNRAHNNEVNGIFVWQNNDLPHAIENFVAYYNGQAGIEHGAYLNSYLYKDLVLLGNHDAIVSHALGVPGEIGDTQIWAKVKTNGGVLRIESHTLGAARPVRFVGCDLGKVVVGDQGGEPSEYDFIGCGLEPSDFDLSNALPNSVFRVQRTDGTAYRLLGNGSVTKVAAFYNGTVPGGGFIDTFGNTFEAAIKWLAAQGITKGCNPPANSKFCPNDRVTRGEMAAFIVRSKGYSAIASDFFIDDNDSIFENAINRLRTAGVTQGCNPPQNNRFCPDRSVTRGEMAAFLVRAFDLPAYNGPDRFKDDNGNLFESAIERLAQAGITLGCNPPANDRYCPNDYVTRGQMAAFLKRALGG